MTYDPSGEALRAFGVRRRDEYGKGSGQGQAAKKAAKTTGIAIGDVAM
jgi:hypothetical protein